MGDGRMEIKFSKKLMEKFGKHVVKRKREWNLFEKVWYKLDWRNNKLINLQEWFRKVSTEAIADEKFVKKVEFFNCVDDQNLRAVLILRYVHSLMTYKKDSDVWQVGEKWQTPLETFRKTTGDCEDGAILIGAFFRWCDIPSEYWSIVCGSVQGGGHCWINYVGEFDARTYHLDWCYWYSSKLIPDRKPYSDDTRYFTEWFGFNDKRSWKKVKKPSEMFK